MAEQHHDDPVATRSGRADDDLVVCFDDDDDDDEFADLFSFATAPSESSSSKHKATDYREAMASVMPLPPSHEDEEGSDNSEDSFLRLLEQQKEPLTIVDGASSASQNKVRSSSPPDLDAADTNLQEMLDWLDQDDNYQEAARQQLEEEIVFLPPTLNRSSLSQDQENLSKQSSEEPELRFETLEEAVKSPKSSLPQIRKLLSQEHFHVSASVRPHLWCRVICGKTLDETLQSSVADSFQQWEQHNKALLHGTDWDGAPPSSTEQPLILPSESTSPLETEKVATGDDIAKHHEDAKNAITSQQSVENTKELSTATSTTAAPEGRNATTETRTETTTLTSYQKAQREWILEQSNILGHRIVAVLKGERSHSQQALASLLLNHYHTGEKPMDEDEEESLHELSHSDSKSTTTTPPTPDYQDPLLPPVACTILSAGVPKIAAAVMFSHIVPHFMPILALTRKEREEAAMLMHRQFYLLACYHLPSLVLHLDRYWPNWFFWSGLGSKKNNEQGFLPQTYLMSHLAGECSSSHDSQGFLLDPRWILALWDLVLTSSNNSLRFFLVLAVLESSADKLVLLTDEALKTKLVQVLRLEQDDSFGAFTIQDSESQTTNQDATQWVQEWTDRAQRLWERTPVSVSRKMKRVEDQAVTEALTKRQQEAEKRMKLKLEAEAKAYQEAVEAERERKADEARLRLTRARLVAFYRQHQPAKENNIDAIMEAYRGRYDVLDSKLKQKYGVGFNPAVKPKVAPARNTSKPTSRPLVINVNGDEQVQKRTRNQLVVKVAPNEVLPEVCWSKEANKVRMFKLDMGNKLDENIETRLPLKFYLVDTRPLETARDQGRFPTSVSFPPEDLTDPERLTQQEEIFEGLRGAIHIVIMGEGFAALPALYGHKMTDRLAECIQEDDARNNNCALFFLKRGFPFVSTLDGGYAAAHAFLYREGKNHHLVVQDVLSDYIPDVSMFGQLERVHNSTGREKAQRALQSIFDSSLVAITKNARRFETLASEVDGDDKQQQKKGGNIVSRFFAVGGVDEDAKRKNLTKLKEQGSENAASESDSKGGPAGPVFRNPFARNQSSQLGRENSVISLDVESVEDLDTDSSYETTDNKGAPPAAMEKYQNITKSVDQKATKSVDQKAHAPIQPKAEQPKANPFAGFGAAFLAASKAATGGDAVNIGRGINPFARFNQQVRNLDKSQHGEKGLASSRHGFGGSRHGFGGSRHGTSGPRPGVGPSADGM